MSDGVEQIDAVEILSTLWAMFEARAKPSDQYSQWLKDMRDGLDLVGDRFLDVVVHELLSSPEVAPLLSDLLRSGNSISDVSDKTRASLVEQLSGVEAALANE